MKFQQKVFNFTLLLFCVTLLSTFCVITSRARNLENSKNELRDSDVAGGGSSVNGKINNRYNTAPASSYYGDKHNLRSFLMAPRDFQQKLHSKFPLNLDLMDLLLEYDDDDRSKRFDDYGHMRFGKRGGEEQFDDYGHMRFGRSV